MQRRRRGAAHGGGVRISSTSLFAGLSAAIIIVFNITNFFRPPPMLEVHRRLFSQRVASAAELARRGVAQLAPAPASSPPPSSRVPPPQKQFFSTTATTLQCTNMAGPWFRAVGARYKPYAAVALEAPYVSEPSPAAPLLDFSPLSAIALAPRSRFAAAAAANRRYLEAMPTDSLLWAWRALAKLPQPKGVKPMRSGWEHPGSELRGHFLGHWLSAAAFAVAADGAATRVGGGGGNTSAALRAKMEAVVATLAECSAALGGYLSAFPASHLDRFESLKPVWAPWYCIHKVIQGLLDQHAHAGSAVALRVATAMAEYIDGRIAKLLATSGLAHHWHTLDMEYGGMNDVLWQVAARTREPRHRRLASLFDKPCALGTLAAGSDPLVGIHANTHVPIVIGGAMRHEVTGEPQLAESTQRFFELITTTRSFATGGSTHGEVWGAPYMLGDTLGPPPRGAEHQESCVSHNMLKVAAKLLRWTANLSYADYTEQVLLNSIFGTQRGDDPGALLYMLPLGAGVSKRDKQAWRTSERGGWSTEHDDMWCCSGTGIEGFAKLAEHAYARVPPPRGISGAAVAAPPELRVLQFIPTTLVWAEAGAVVHLNATDLSRAPHGSPLVLTLGVAPLDADRVATWAALGVSSGQMLTINVRIPPWAWDGEPPSASVNGQPVPIARGARELRVTRAWAAADVLSVALRPTLRLVGAPDTRRPYVRYRAVFYGPLLLAALAHERGVRTLDAPPARPSAWLTPVPAAARAQYVSVRSAAGTAWVHAQGRAFLRTVQPPPPSERPFGGGGTNGSAAATWRMLPLDGGAVVFEAYDRPGMYLGGTGGGKQLGLASTERSRCAFRRRPPLSGAAGAASFESAGADTCPVGWYIAADADGAPLRLVEAPTAPADGVLARSASFVVGKPTELPPPLAFWAKPPLPAAGTAGTGGEGFLVYALNEMLDERYSVYLQLSGKCEPGERCP